MSRPAARYLLCFAALIAVGCAPAVGDDCHDSVDCSATNSRLCDINQPGGYCTLQGCDSETCPDDAICVEWRYSPARTAETWCMAACDDGGDCRDAYSCLHESDERLQEDGMSIARVVDKGGRANSKFCTFVE